MTKKEERGYPLVGPLEKEARGSLGCLLANLTTR